MKGKSKADQRLIVLTALRDHDRWINKRFFAVICGLLGIVGFSVHLTQSYSTTGWMEWLVVLACVFLFYAYILWEINGPVFRAVERYLSRQN
jgi:hypothetical protein